MKEDFSEEEAFSQVLKTVQYFNLWRNVTKATKCVSRKWRHTRRHQHRGVEKEGNGNNLGVGMDGGGTLSVKPRSPAKPIQLYTGSLSVEMRQATDRSGITHSSHCSLPFMPGLAEILLLIWDILFCF